MMKKVVIALVTVISIAVVRGQSAAQVCGSGCDDCGFYSWEGIVDPTHEGLYGQTCDFNPILGYCSSCHPVAISPDHVPPMLIAETLAAAVEGEVGAVVEAYGERLRLNPAQQQIVVVGTACDRLAPGAVLNVNAERWSALEDVGLPKWEGAAERRAPTME